MAQAMADLPERARDLLAGVAGCSPYLAELLRKHGAWWRSAVHMPPEQAFQAVLGELDFAQLPSLAADLRRAKGRAALLVALADLGGVWDTRQVTSALTRLADRAVQCALQHLLQDEARRGRLPGVASQGDDAGLFLLAMGKMGAGELNYSSDIDLICLFDQDRYGEAAASARAALVRLVRRLVALLQDVTPDGYVFRCDLRLRPDAAVTPICLSMAAAEQYYEAEGRTWERAAYIKARPCAGDLAAGGRFLRALVPFVWRKHLDFAAIQDAHDMRLRIRAHRGLHGPIRLAGHNLKLGAGGIREIEFFAQTRQLIAGGRDASLRDPTTLGALAALAGKGWVQAGDAQTLSRHYLALRDMEHRVQMIGDAQTHDLPQTPEGMARLAALCGMGLAEWQRDLLARLQETDAITDAFFAPPGAPTSAPTSAPISPPTSTAAPPAEGPGPELPPAALPIIQGWHRYPALRAPRAQALFAQLQPSLTARVARSDAPMETLMALDGFLSGLPAGVQVFSLFQANPQLVDLIIDIAATAPPLARYLARHSSVLDGVIGGTFFGPWPALADLTADLARVLAGTQGYEARLDAARGWQKEWHFRIGVHFLRGYVTPAQAGAHYADLAQAVMAALWPVVCDEFAAKHGPSPGRGAAILGMGSLGAGRLNAASDLDVILIYDDAGIEGSNGPRPLSTRQYYARLMQGFVAALSAQTARGRLYAVDLRLRPSGRKGPVATQLTAFDSYQRFEAWTWEHLALTRARVITGPADLSAQIEALRCDILRQKSQQDAGLLRADVADMRARLAQTQPSPLPEWETKAGAGRMLDIDLFAQLMALQTACPQRSTPEQIAAGVAAGLITPAKAQALVAAHQRLGDVHQALRLLAPESGAVSGAGAAAGPQPGDPQALGAGGRAFVAASAHIAARHIGREIAQAAAEAEAIINRFCMAKAPGAML